MNRPAGLPVVAGLALVTSGLCTACGVRQETGETRERPAAVQQRDRAQPSAAEGSVVLDSVAESRAGIVTITVQRASRGREVRLTGEVIPDSSRIITIRAPVAGRLVALDSAPWPLFGQSVSAGRVLGQVSDAKPLVAPRTGTVTRVGAVPGELVQPGELLLEITDFTEPLVRVVWRPDAPPSPPASLTIAPLGLTAAGVSARLIGPASEVDPLSRTPVYWYRAERAWPNLRPGAPIEARFADPRITHEGLLVPTDAIVQWEGLAWIYVARGHGRYVRASITTDYPVDGGYLVGSGLSAGNAIVVRGAQQLLSEEFRARTRTGEEDEP